MIKSIIMRDLKGVLMLVFSEKDFTTFSKKDFFGRGGGGIFETKYQRFGTIVSVCQFFYLSDYL